MGLPYNACFAKPYRFRVRLSVPLSTTMMQIGGNILAVS